MKLKPKAARRLLLVSVVVVLALSALAALVVVRSWQNDRRTRLLREEGMTAYKQADYPVALDNLAGFLRRKPKDREAWLAFADAREKVEEAGGRHLVQAAVAYKRAWDLDSTDVATGLKLARLYNEINQSVEAKDLAMHLRPADPKDAGPANLEAMIEEASAREALKSFDPTLDALTTRIVALDPDGYRASILRGAFLAGAGNKSAALDFAKSRADAHPGDPRFEFLSEVLVLQSGQSADPKQFIAILCRAAGLNPDVAKRVAQPTYNDTILSGQLASCFDHVDMYLHALQVLKDAAFRLHDPDSRRLAIRREWQAGLPSDVLTDFADIDTTPKGDHSDILAFKALSCRDLGKRDQALALLTALRARPRDFIAISWSKALSALLEKTDPKEVLALLDSAIKDHPGEPVFTYLRGDTLWRLGRADEARQAWESVYKSNLAVGWAAPAVREAETLLDEGRLEEGQRAATAAVQRVRFSPASNLVLLRANAALIEAGRPPSDTAGLLRQMDGIGEQIKRLDNAPMQAQVRRLILPARITLLVADGRKDEARALAEQAITEPGLLDADLARRLSLVSTRLGLGLEDRLLTAATSGSNDPSTLLSRALMLDAAGKHEAALALVNAPPATSSTPPTTSTPADPSGKTTPADRAPETAIARAQFYDITGHADALKVWKSTVAAYPNSLPVQVSALRAGASAADPAFVDQLAARITELGGSDSDHPTADIRFARARAMLFQSPSSRSRDEAVSILRTLVVENPGRLDVRNALVDALLLDNAANGVRPDYASAIDQLTATAALAPDRAPYTLRLAAVLQQQGRTPEAITQLSSLALDHAASPDGRLDAIDRLTNLREQEAALRGLDTLLEDPGSALQTNPRVLMRGAALLSSLRRDREAIDAYRAVLKLPTTDAEIIANLASAFLSFDDHADADAAMAKLDDPAIKPQDRDLARAMCAVAAGDAPTALAEYTRATQDAPTDPATWSALARFHLGRAENAPAEQAARHGLEHSPDNPQLGVLLQQILLAGKDDATADLGPLAAALAKNPATVRRAAAISAIASARKNGAFDDAAVLSKLADEFVDDPTTQLFVTSRLLALKPPHVGDAARITRRAASRYPTDPSVQEQAAHTLADAGDWDGALVAATAWRALVRQPAADLAVAEAHVALGHARQALDTIRAARLPDTITDTDSLALGILNVRVRATVILRDTAGAFQLLEKYLSQSAVVRTRIGLPIASTLVPDADGARTWIQAIASRMDPQSIDDQLAITGAWALASSRFPSAATEFLKTALAITDPLVTHPDAPPRLFEVRASLLDSTGDKPGAIAACREALNRDPKSIPTMTHLARLMMTGGSDPGEAIALAKQASQASPGNPGPLLVLAQAQLQQAGRREAAGDNAGRDTARADAAATLKQLAIIPDAPADAVGQMAGIAEQLNDSPTAITLYERAIASPRPPTGRDVGVMKNNLAFLLLTQGNAAASKDLLRRAKSLADDAVQLAEIAPTYETLGSVDTAIDDRPGAIAAYRKALSLDSNSLAASIGLADLLAAGTPQERAEAATLIQHSDAAIAAGAHPSSTRSAQLQQAKQKLAKP